MNHIALNIDKAAEAVCVSTDTIRKAIRDGELIAHVRASKQLILAEDLRSWVEDGPVSFGAPPRTVRLA